MKSSHVKTLINLSLYAVSLLALLLVGPRLLSFFMPLVLGWVIACIANPLVHFCESRLKIIRKHGSLVVIVGVLSLVISGCYFIIAWLFREALALVQSIPASFSTVMASLREVGGKLSQSLTMLPPEMKQMVADIFTNMESYIGEFIGKLGAPTLSLAGDIAGSIPNLLVMAIFMLLAAYFFVAQKDTISARFRSILPRSFIGHMTWLKNMFSRAVGGYFVAQFKIMGVIAVILWVGFTILKVPYAVPLAILISMLDFLPFLGTGTAIWPWSVYLVLTGNYYLAAGLMIVYVICLFVHQVLQPKFVGDTVGMDSLTTLVCMFIGYRFSSVFGMIIAVPIGIIIQNLYKEGAFDKIIRDVRALVVDFNKYRKS